MYHNIFLLLLLVPEVYDNCFLAFPSGRHRFPIPFHIAYF